MRFHSLYRKALKLSASLLKNPAAVLNILQRVNQKTAKGNKRNAAIEKQVPFWKERIHLLRRMIKAYIEGRYTPASYKLIVRSLAVLVYFLWLFDLIPDVIPVLGYIDDATLLAWLLSGVNDELNRFQAWEEQI